LQTWKMKSLKQNYKKKCKEKSKVWTDHWNGWIKGEISFISNCINISVPE
jgi:hypothetical protein